MTALLAPLVLVSGVVGAGIFELPALLRGSGIIPFFATLLSAGILVGFLHAEYLAITTKHPGQSIGSLLRQFYNSLFGIIGSLAVYGGLLLGMLVCLILAGLFGKILFPALPIVLIQGLFWAAVSLPLIMSMEHRMELRLLIASLTVCLALFVGAGAFPLGNLNVAPIGPHPWSAWGGILFALAGWASAEQVGKYTGNEKKGKQAIIRGTILILILYGLFVLAIVSKAPQVTADTLSGLTGIPYAIQALLVCMGLTGLWNSYGAIIREFTESLEEDTQMASWVAKAVGMGSPILLLISGMTNLLHIVSIGGGIFIGLQYGAIALIAWRAIPQTQLKKIFLVLSGSAFLLASIATSVAWW